MNNICNNINTARACKNNLKNTFIIWNETDSIDLPWFASFNVDVINISWNSFVIILCETLAHDLFKMQFDESSNTQKNSIGNSLMIF